MMKKTILPVLSALGLLAACSGGADAPKDDATVKAEAQAAADDDNDSAAPAPAKAEEDHPHDGSEGADHKH
jgi:ABC-type glycerol-3-phosphate transport system substrate-binding protein